MLIRNSLISARFSSAAGPLPPSQPSEQRFLLCELQPRPLEDRSAPDADLTGARHSAFIWQCCLTQLKSPYSPPFLWFGSLFYFFLSLVSRSLPSARGNRRVVRDSSLIMTRERNPGDWRKEEVKIADTVRSLARSLHPLPPCTAELKTNRDRTRGGYSSLNVYVLVWLRV